METNAERRRRKLIELCSQYGGEAGVAKEAGLSAEALKQITRGYKSSHTKKGDGSPSERALGDPAARAIETAYDLGRGWFDNDIPMSPQELQMLGFFRALSPALQSIVIENVQQAAKDEAEALERVGSRLSFAGKRAKPTVPGDAHVGGMSGFGDLEGPAHLLKERKK